MFRKLFIFLFLALALFAQKRPFDVNAMMELKRISDPQISPDGRWVAFGVQTVDLAANKKPQQIWIVPLAGGTPRQITRDGQDNERARWSPDSKQMAYISDRGGSSQVWLMDADGSNAKQVTNLSTEAGGVLFSPDGKMAYLRSANEMTVPGPHGAPTTVHLQGYTIWRMDTDGQWRCVVDLGTEAPTAAAPAKT